MGTTPPSWFKPNRGETCSLEVSRLPCGLPLRSLEPDMHVMHLLKTDQRSEGKTPSTSLARVGENFTKKTPRTPPQSFSHFADPTMRFSDEKRRKRSEKGKGKEKERKRKEKGIEKEEKGRKGEEKSRRKKGRTKGRKKKEKRKKREGKKGRKRRKGNRKQKKRTEKEKSEKTKRNGFHHTRAGRGL